MAAAARAPEFNLNFMQKDTERCGPLFGSVEDSGFGDRLQLVHITAQGGDTTTHTEENIKGNIYCD